VWKQKTIPETTMANIRIHVKFFIAAAVFAMCAVTMFVNLYTSGYGKTFKICTIMKIYDCISTKTPDSVMLYYDVDISTDVCKTTSQFTAVTKGGSCKTGPVSEGYTFVCFIKDPSTCQADNTGFNTFLAFVLAGGLSAIMAVVCLTCGIIVCKRRGC